MRHEDVHERLYSVSQNDVTSLTGYRFNTHPPIFIFLANVISRHSKISYRYNFLNYLAFTYFILLQSEMAKMTRFPRHCYSVTGAFRRASLTRPSINGQYDCVHAWRRIGFILKICCKQPVFFQSHPTTKTVYFPSHPQSTEENTLHFTCLACGSLQGSVSTQEYR